MKNFTSKAQKIGELGEDVACKYLEQQGFVILERNYTKKWGEIDIIAQKDTMLYFIEVKGKSVQDLNSVSRQEGGQAHQSGGQAPQTLTNWFSPEENVHPWKRKRLARTIQTYLIHKRIGNTPWQFDILVVYLDMQNRKARVKRIENVIL